MTTTLTPRLTAMTLVAVLILAACGGDSGGDAAPTAGEGTPATTSAETTAARTATPVAGSVRLDVPDGWAVSEDGLATAANADDLDIEFVVGPRVVATVNAAATDPIVLLEHAFDEHAYTVTAGPDEVVIDGSAGVAITLRWSPTQVAADGEAGPVDFIVRYITVASPTGDSVLFELIARADQWDAIAATLEQIPSLTE